MFGKFRFTKDKTLRLLLVLLAVFVSWAIASALYPKVGPISGAIYVLPVILGSWVIGWQVGLGVSLLGILLNWEISTRFGTLNHLNMLINGIVVIGISILIAWMRKLTDHERNFSQELQQKYKILAYTLSDTEDFSSALLAQTAGLHKVLEATKAMTATIELEETVKVIAKEIATSIEASGCTISSWNQTSDTVETMIDYRIEDLDSFDDRGTIYSLNDFPTTRRVLEQGKIITIYQNDQNADPVEVEYFKQQNTFSSLLMPIKYEDKVIGLVEIDDIEDRKFTEEDINTVLKLVEHAGTAFHNAKIFKEIQFRLREQTLLAKAVTTITTSLNQNTTLQLLCEQMCIAMDASSVYVCTIEEDTKDCTVIAEYIGLNATREESISDLGETYRVEDPRFFEFILTGHPMTDQHDSQELGTLEKNHMSKYDVKTILYLPLKMKREAKGFIEVWDSQQKRIFSENEISLGKALAEHTSIALENIFLHDEVAEAESRFRSIAENSPDHILLLDKNLIIRYVNYPSPGLTIDQLLGTPLYSYVEEDQADRVRQVLQSVLETSKPSNYETSYKDPNGHLIYYESRVSPHKSDGEISGLVINSRDISHRIELEKKLEYLAMHDALTGLPNRRFLESRLNETIKLITRQGLRLEIAILDLDNFKDINDQYGHTVGDQVLIELGKRLKDKIRGSDFPARFGGDEFIVLFVEDRNTPKKGLHERFESIFLDPVQVEQHEIFVSASIGYSFYSGEEEIDGEKIIKQADDAMYQLKEQKEKTTE